MTHRGAIRSRSPGWSAPGGGSTGRQIHSQGTRPVDVGVRPDRDRRARSVLARLSGTARSCRTTHPSCSSGASSRAVRRSPAAPRRQATASWPGRNRSPSRPRWPPARRGSAPAWAPAGCQELPHRHRCRPATRRGRRPGGRGRPSSTKPKAARSRRRTASRSGSSLAMGAGRLSLRWLVASGPEVQIHPAALPLQFIVISRRVELWPVDQ
jgi:hypothetical protein